MTEFASGEAGKALHLLIARHLLLVVNVYPGDSDARDVARQVTHYRHDVVAQHDNLGARLQQFFSFASRPGRPPMGTLVLPLSVTLCEGLCSNFPFRSKSSRYIRQKRWPPRKFICPHHHPHQATTAAHPQMLSQSSNLATGNTSVRRCACSVCFC